MSLGEQIVSMEGGKARFSDVIAISAVAKAFIVCLLETGWRETLGGRSRAHRTEPSINRLC